MKTLSDILINANSVLDLEAALPTDDDLDVRINYAQQAVQEWSEAYRPKELTTEYTALATLGTISLPDNFKELETITTDLNGNQYPEILPKDKIKQEEDEKYSYITGNNATGYIMRINSLASMATLSLVYQRHPSSMATLTDICEVPDHMFVVQKVISLVLQSRSDERFPIMEADAQRRLVNMVGRGMVQTPGGYMSMRRTGSGRWKIGRSRG